VPNLGDQTHWTTTPKKKIESVSGYRDDQGTWGGEPKKTPGLTGEEGKAGAEIWIQENRGYLRERDRGSGEWGRNSMRVDSKGRGVHRETGVHEKQLGWFFKCPGKLGDVSSSWAKEKTVAEVWRVGKH